MRMISDLLMSAGVSDSGLTSPLGMAAAVEESVSSVGGCDERSAQKSKRQKHH